MWLQATVLLLGAGGTLGIEIPNGIIGSPEVECGEETIAVIFNTRDDFQGRVFAVGHSEKPECSTTERERRTTSIELDKESCGIVQLRTDNPPGLYVTVKVMINFHPDGFITKVDRGFEISCFYMEAEKTVTFPITVSMQPLEQRTELAEMPRCRYEVLDAETQRPATVVSVGDPLLHKWTCESTTPSLWCMTVHSCFVEDGQGTQISILQPDGCAKDKFLLDNLEYTTDLMAEKEAHAFKFADRVVVNFQCSVRLDIRDGSCPKPQCRSLRRIRRALGLDDSEEEDEDEEEWRRRVSEPPSLEIDVRSTQLDVIDTLADFGVKEGGASQAAAAAALSSLARRRGSLSPPLGQASSCRHQLLLLSAVSAALLLFSAAASALLYRSRREK